MVYKINLEKKKEFESFYFRQVLKLFFPILIPAAIFMGVRMGFVLTDGFETIRPFDIYIVLFSCLFLFIIFFISAFIGTKIASSKLEMWELSIRENYATLKNSIAVTAVNFADFKKYKETADSITFYFRGIRRFYINWNCFHDSENLKAELENIAHRIGTFKRETVSVETPKTNVKFKSKFKWIFYIILAMGLIIKIVIKFL